MHFTKMHGLGNDYVFVSLFEEEVRDPAELARCVSRRNHGVGSDGLILLQPSPNADLGMRIFNADGSEAEMCGNGLRCAAKYAFDHSLCDCEQMTIETGAGILTVRVTVEEGVATAANANMGEPRLRRRDIPMDGPDDPRVVGEALELVGHRLLVTCLSMGNPHCVVPVGSLDGTPWTKIGPLVETHPVFPRRTNVEFVETLSRNEVKVAVWERGSGPTLACGTGAAAVCVAMSLLGETERTVIVHLPGGDLQMEWSDEDNCVYMTGPAVEVFAGEWPG